MRYSQLSVKTLYLVSYEREKECMKLEGWGGWGKVEEKKS